MKVALIIGVMVCSAIANATKLHPLSDEFINLINSKQSTWKAGRNFDNDYPLNLIKRRMGLLKPLKPYNLKPTVFTDYADIPDTFDARANWPECTDVISTIVDQSNCGSCWAVAAASAMSDRRCIASGGKLTVPVSGSDLMSCATFDDGCEGGYLIQPWNHWQSNGIVTGGPYNSSVGCIPYPFPNCEHHSEGDLVPCSDLPSYSSPDCKSKCTNGDLNYKSELTRGSELEWYWSVRDIQKAIMQEGPVEAGFNVYEDFLSYKSGVYQHVTGGITGAHAVRIIGWGKENDVNYWLVANSWNPSWGDKGYFKILRGKNECGIEEQVMAAIPKLS